MQPVLPMRHATLSRLLSFAVLVAACSSAAGKAKQLLEEHGFSNVVNGGGYEALK